AVRPPDVTPGAAPNAGPPGGYRAESPADEEAPVVRTRRGRRSANRAAAQDDHLDASPSAWLAEPDDGWAEPEYDDPPPRRGRVDDGHADQDAAVPHDHYEHDAYAAPDPSRYAAAEPDAYPAEPDLYGSGEHDAYGAAEPDGSGAGPVGGRYGRHPQAASRGRHGPPPEHGHPGADEHPGW
ncbi:MAG TPA: hypothetical protein VES42_05055, partial [Pilimelia sp.]|nr:hypothetical protein [Pilimelia sp.]